MPQHKRVYVLDKRVTGYPEHTCFVFLDKTIVHRPIRYRLRYPNPQKR